MTEPAAPPPVPMSATAVGGGLVAGAAAGLFGVGGGVLLVPLLVLLLKRSQHVAHATSLVAITLAAITGTARFALDGSVAWAGGAAVAVGAIAGARFGARFLPKLSESGLRRLFAVALLVLAARFLLVGASGEAALAGDVTPALSPLMLTLHVIGGLAAGMTSAVLGVGGGIIMVPLLVLGFGYGQHIAEGTSLAVIIPTAMTGAWAHHRNGYTDWTIGAQLGLSSVLGSLAGASLALSLDPVTLGRLYGGLQLVVAMLMLRPTPAPDAPETIDPEAVDGGAAPAAVDET